MNIAVTFYVDSKVKEEATKRATLLGVPLDKVLNTYLEWFTHEGTGEDDLAFEIPLEKELMWLKEGAEALKNGKRYTDVEELISDCLK